MKTQLKYFAQLEACVTDKREINKTKNGQSFRDETVTCRKGLNTLI